MNPFRKELIFTVQQHDYARIFPELTVLEKNVKVIIEFSTMTSKFPTNYLATPATRQGDGKGTFM
jgi:hypothetical protein